MRYQATFCRHCATEVEAERFDAENDDEAMRIAREKKGERESEGWVLVEVVRFILGPSLS